MVPGTMLVEEHGSSDSNASFVSSNSICLRILSISEITWCVCLVCSLAFISFDHLSNNKWRGPSKHEITAFCTWFLSTMRTFSLGKRSIQTSEDLTKILWSAFVSRQNLNKQKYKVINMWFNKRIISNNANRKKQFFAMYKFKQSYLYANNPCISNHYLFFERKPLSLQKLYAETLYDTFNIILRILSSL